MDRGTGIASTTDGGYILVGYTESYGAGMTDIMLVKTDSSGQLEWFQTYGDDSVEEAECVRQTIDGGYIIGGRQSNMFTLGIDAILLKTDSNGNQLWIQNYGGRNYDYAMHVEQTEDEGYILAGATASYANSRDIYIVKTNSLGDEEWHRSFGFDGYDMAYDVKQTLDGGYIVAGSSEINGPSDDAILIKIDSEGNTDWYNHYGGGGVQCGRSLCLTLDGGYTVGGNSNNGGPYWGDMYIFKVDSLGSLIWEYTNCEASSQVAESIFPTADGGFAAAGYGFQSSTSSSSIALVKLDAFGNEEWLTYYDWDSDESAKDLIQVSDGTFIILGHTESFGAGDFDFYLLKTDPDNLPLIDDLTIRLIGNEIVISWSEIPFADSYNIYRGREPNFFEIGLIPIGNTNTCLFIDTFSPENNNYYRVTVEY